MFTIKVQSVSQNKRGMNEYSNLKSMTLSSFSPKVADEALAKVSDNVRVSFYIAHDDQVPAGWASKRLEFTTQIWKAQILDEDQALATLSELPF